MVNLIVFINFNPLNRNKSYHTNKRYKKKWIFFLEGKNLEINDELTSDLWEEVLDKGYSFRFKAFGVSMLPLIRAGDILTIKPVEYVDLSIGDRKKIN